MATPPNNHQAPLKYQTWTLRVPIHCEGCKKKVRKILQSMDGVYMTTIDSQQHKVIVTGNIESETLLKKLSKSGKPAQLWPDQKPKEIIQESAPNIEENKDNPEPKPKDEQVNQNPDKNATDPTQPSLEACNDQNGQRKKKKKKKGKNSNSTDSDNFPSREAPPPSTPPLQQPIPPPESTPPVLPPEQEFPPPKQGVSMEPPPPLPQADAPPQGPPPIEPPMEHEKIPIESLNLGPLPMHHHQQGHHPYFRQPMNNPGYMHMPQLAHNLPPPPQMGVSYSMAQPRTSGSYYVPPAYPYYAYPHHPLMNNVTLPPLQRPINDYYDNHDQYDRREYNDDAASQCRLM